jgi:hypothetical protein
MRTLYDPPPEAADATHVLFWLSPGNHARCPNGGWFLMRTGDFLNPAGAPAVALEASIGEAPFCLQMRAGEKLGQTVRLTEAPDPDARAQVPGPDYDQDEPEPPATGWTRITRVISWRPPAPRAPLLGHPRGRRELTPPRPADAPPADAAE